MSFSSEVKEELSKLNNLKNKEIVYFELLGYLISKNTKVEKKKIRYSTESEYNINRLNKLLNNLFIRYNIEMQGKLYVITFNKLKGFKEIEYVNDNIILNLKENLNKEKNIKALIRGCFLGGGLINDPNKKYHFEINFSQEKNIEIIKELLLLYNIKAKTLQREGSISLYLKEGEDISNILALMEATNSMLKFEEIRVIKEARNNVNRIVNCEVANLGKTVTAAGKQISAIKKLKQSKKYNDLSDDLKEIADIRLKNPDLSLVELGKLLKEPIGKSGVNYRLNKIIKIAKDL